MRTVKQWVWLMVQPLWSRPAPLSCNFGGTNLVRTAGTQPVAGYLSTRPGIRMHWYRRQLGFGTAALFVIVRYA
jgi:hypothetical protein